MKYLKIMLISLAILFIVPFSVFADEDKTSKEDVKEESKEEVKVYFFHGNGCPHCEDAHEWFNEIEDEYGKLFNLESYEVWYDKENKALMEDVADAKGDVVNGVPYIVVGDKSWNGFDEDVADEILDAIKADYDKDTAQRYNVMNNLNNVVNSSRDIWVLLLIITIIGLFTGGILVIRKKNMN